MIQPTAIVTGAHGERNEPRGSPSDSSSHEPGGNNSNPNPDSKSKSKAAETSLSPGPVRHMEFWLRDGSIVLSVQDTLFKVHQTILANHSEVFADLFSVPQPQLQIPGEGGSGDRDGGGDVVGATGRVEGRDIVDGCVVVHLYDSSDDFVDLLRAIYYPSHFDNLAPNADLDTLLTFIAGILRLSTKYLIRELRKRCIALLTSRFPTTYQEYLTRSSSPPSSSYGHPYTPAQAQPIAVTQSVSGTSTVPGTPSGPSTPLGPSTLHTPPSLPTPPVYTPPGSTLATATATIISNAPPPRERSKHKPSSIMRAMHLAQQTNVPLILPYASYLLARTSPRRLLSHTPSSISWHQKTITLVGREQLRLAEMSITHAFLLAFRPAAGCVAPAFCGNARGPHAEWHLIESGGGGGGTGGAGKAGRGPNPLRGYERWERMNVCQECVREGRREHERGREEVWERLPEFFEMGSWAELRAAQDSWSRPSKIKDSQIVRVVNRDSPWICTVVRTREERIPSGWKWVPAARKGLVRFMNYILDRIYVGLDV
ncbi:hypothetical protein BDZ94DRAFT_1300085 [Collybia nuda]|uniref:BTB domain-containing protein n=1 Tax=Collybia nuda TaxID=64659 RepID=A0A9P5Y2H8_9AGAR|nr:hypothetical protein BDZ94DRAFT_1300085 [Collybia nuda]